MAVDEAGNVVRFDGAVTTVTPLAADCLYDIYGNYGTKEYAVGRKGDGRVFCRHGMQWSLVDSFPSPATAVAVYLHSSGSEILLVGTEDGGLYRYMDGSRTHLPDVFQQGTPLRVAGLWAKGDDAFAAGGSKVAHIDVLSGAVLDVTSLGVQIDGIWGTSVTNVWAVGRYCRIFHFDGAEWALHTNLLLGSSLRSVYGYGPCDVYAAGDYGRVFHLEWPVAVGDVIPQASALHQNYPNPFNPYTTIAFETSCAGWVTLVVYDVTGRPVRTLLDEERTPGAFRERWDGRDDSGRKVASGVYFYRLTTPGADITRKLVLVR
jgi:hypothetical protein